MGDANDHEGPPFFRHRSSSYDLNSKIMLAAIISLSVIVILVIVLHIYTRCVHRRRLSAFLAPIRSIGYPPPRTGLDPMIVASLPVFAFRQTGPAAECSVCLSSLEEEEMVRLLPNCKHLFHAECIDVWLGSRSTCPICRTEAQPHLPPEPREGPAGSPPTAPPRLVLEVTESSDVKLGGSSSSSRLRSFRRMISMERLSRRLQSADFLNNTDDLERQ